MKYAKTHYKGKPVKMAKCGKYSLHHCLCNFHECDDCKVCKLVPHRFYKLYKMIDGIKHKRCARCKEYKPVAEFVYNKATKYYNCWCKKCLNTYKSNSNETKSI